MVEKILLDTDIGSDVDDALALLFALKTPALSLEGITTVYGCTDVRAKIAKKIIDYAGKSDIPVYVGEKIPLYSDHSVWHTGLEGKGILSQEECLAPPEQMGIKEGAVDFLIEKIMQRPGEYNLVTIGALTNVAKALKLEPRIEDKIKRMYVMGGTLSYPKTFNPEAITPAYEAEHNIRCDIEAARIVFRSDIPKTLFPLDVTVKTPISREDFEVLGTKGESEQAVKQLVDVWFKYRENIFRSKVESTCMHDPLTVAGIVYPELLETVRLPISVNGNGITFVKEGAKLIEFCYGVDYPKFREIFLETITK